MLNTSLSKRVKYTFYYTCDSFIVDMVLVWEGGGCDDVWGRPSLVTSLTKFTELFHHHHHHHHHHHGEDGSRPERPLCLRNRCKITNICYKILQFSTVSNPASCSWDWVSTYSCIYSYI